MFWIKKNLRTIQPLACLFFLIIKKLTPACFKPKRELHMIRILLLITVLSTVFNLSPVSAQREYWMRGYEYHFNSYDGRELIRKNRIATMEVTDVKPQNEALQKVRHRFYFNENGLMTNKSTYFNNRDSASYFIYYYYDENKRLTRTRYFIHDTLRGERNYHYDNKGRLAEETSFLVYQDYFPTGGLKYEWINDSIKVKINLRNGKQEIFKYDRRGGLTEYRNDTTKIPVTYHNFYNLYGKRVKTVNYNALGEEYGKQDYNYDSASRLIRAVLKDSEYLFTFDENNLLKEERKIHSRSSSIQAATYKYTYW
jgi:hypothetical protein